jgi:hypothetical protein
MALPLVVDWNKQYSRALQKSLILQKHLSDEDTLIVSQLYRSYLRIYHRLKDDLTVRLSQATFSSKWEQYTLLYVQFKRLHQETKNGISDTLLSSPRSLSHQVERCRQLWEEYKQRPPDIDPYAYLDCHHRLKLELNLLRRGMLAFDPRCAIVDALCRNIKQLRTQMFFKLHHSERPKHLSSCALMHGEENGEVKQNGTFHLNERLLKAAKPLIDDRKHLKRSPRATSGKTPVYLPKNLSVVLKHSGFSKSKARLEQMMQARAICEKNGYQCLVIPEADVYKDFIVEQRLPIVSYSLKRQVGLYIEQSERFTCAVKELTGFLCQSSLFDIVGGSDPYGMSPSTRVGRYDNINLYLEEGRGKIGLIDLERFNPVRYQFQEEWCFFICKDAVRLFPNHLDAILEVAKEFDPNIEQYCEALVRERDQVLECFKGIYFNHLAFALEKGISMLTPSEIRKIAPEIREEIERAVIEKMQTQQDLKQQSVRRLKKKFPKLLDLITDFLSQYLQEKARGSEEPMLAYSQLLAHRTLRFSIHSQKYRGLKRQIVRSVKLDRRVAAALIEGIFTELARAGEIAYYNPSVGLRSHARQCIFC